MPFSNELPEWNKTAASPTTTKKNAGWSAGEKPPASIFDWFFNKTYLALQELQLEAINVDQKGVNNGVATLDASGDLPIGQADNILNWVKGNTQLVKLTQDTGYATDKSGTDLNNLATPGMYTGNNFTNPPIAGDSNSYRIFVEVSGPDVIGQFATKLTTGQRFSRIKKTVATWTDWVELVSLTNAGTLNVPNQSYVHVNDTDTISINSTVDTKLSNLTSKIFDVQGEFTNSRFTAKETGSYYVRAMADWGTLPGGDSYLKVYKNGVYYTWIDVRTNQRWLFGSLPIKLNAGEYIELYISQYSGSVKTLETSNFMICKFA